MPLPFHLAKPRSDVHTLGIIVWVAISSPRLPFVCPPRLRRNKGAYAAAGSASPCAVSRSHARVPGKIETPADCRGSIFAHATAVCRRQVHAARVTRDASGGRGRSRIIDYIPERCDLCRFRRKAAIVLQEHSRAADVPELLANVVHVTALGVQACSSRCWCRPSRWSSPAPARRRLCLRHMARRSPELPSSSACSRFPVDTCRRGGNRWPGTAGCDRPGPALKPLHRARITVPPGTRAIRTSYASVSATVVTTVSRPSSSAVRRFPPFKGTPSAEAVYFTAGSRPLRV